MVSWPPASTDIPWIGETETIGAWRAVGKKRSLGTLKLSAQLLIHLRPMLIDSKLEIESLVITFGTDNGDVT